jgi:branched-chain amino acid transport system substrate-binding protein
MGWRYAGRAAVLAACVALCTACGGGAKDGGLPASVTSIVAGFSYTGSGPAAGDCRAVRSGYELWAVTVNHAGGLAIGERRVSVELKGYDDAGNAAQAARNAERLLTQDGSALLLGPCGVATTQAVATVAEQYGRLLIVTAPYADATLAHGYSNVVDVAPTLAAAGAAATGYLAALSPRPRVAVLWADDQPARGLGAAIVAAARKSGLAVDPLGGYPPGATDFSAQVAQLQAEAGAAVLIAGRPAEAAALRSALAGAQYSPSAFIVAPTQSYDDVAAAFGPAGTGAMLLAPRAPLDATSSEPLFGNYARFASAFSNAAGYQPGALGTLAVAGGELAGAALSGAQSLDNSALRGWFARGGHLPTVAGALPIAVAGGGASVQSIAGGALPAPRGAGSPVPYGTPVATPARRAAPRP